MMDEVSKSDMKDFFGLKVDNSTFAHKQSVFLSDVHQLFNEELDESDASGGENMSNIQFFYYGSDRMLLVLKHPASLYFRGGLSVKCLAGSVEVDGHILKSEFCTSRDVYSPSSNSALFFSTIEGQYNVLTELETILRLRGAEHILEELSDEESPISCAVLLSRNKLHGFIDLSFEMQQALLPERRLYGGMIYFPEAEERLNCVFDLPSGHRIKDKIKHSNMFINASKELLSHKAPRLAVCGEKGVGKSTALRFLVNQLLSVWQSVLFIDFDIGQPEFTVPGCVSITLVYMPLLGPSYTHITTPLRSIFLGFVNADLCIDNYHDAIKEFEDFCLETSDFSSIPWLINTMGYVKGCGLILLNDIVSRFQLTHCFQLNNAVGKSNKKDIPIISQVRNGNSGSKYVFKSFKMFQPSKNTSNITPRTCRELMISFYFNRHKFFLNFQKIRIRCNEQSSDENTVVFESLLNNNYLMRGEVVAICAPTLESCYHMVPHLKHCVGFGLVVSFCGNELTILTPVHQSTFEEGSYIVRGDLEVSRGFANDILCTNNAPAQNKSCIVLTDGSQASCPSLFSFVP